MNGVPPLYFGPDQATWESLYLKHMGEPSLSQCQTNGGEAELRFLWDRSLSPPIAARLVVHHDGTGTLFIHMLAHSAGVPLLEPEIEGKTVPEDVWYRQTLEKRVQLTTGQVARVVHLAGKVSFESDRTDPKKITTDGSDWIFETQEAGRYRVADFRNYPPKSARDLGLYLVADLGGIRLQPSEIY